MKKYGLIGKSLKHSFSPNYFRKKFESENISDCSYEILELQKIADISALVGQGLSGFNVTIPYKTKVLAYLDWISEDAILLGAVNTVKIVNSRLYGYNTDVFGFEQSLRRFINGDQITSALVLGSGGASKAVTFVLKKLGISYNIVSRKDKFLNYGALTEDIFAKYRLIINTTPLGMFPNVNDKPDLPYHFIGSNHYLFDLVYNPQKSLFLKLGEARNANIINGIEMLHLQAEKSWEIWNKKD